MQKITKQQQRENCKKWIDALRSEDYKPSEGFFRFNNTYSPAGVGLDVSGASEWRVIVRTGYATNHPHNHIYSYVIIGESEHEICHTAYDILHTYYGLSYEQLDEIANIFDKGKSFDYIATWIDWNHG